MVTLCLMQGFDVPANGSSRFEKGLIHGSNLSTGQVDEHWHQMTYSPSDVFLDVTMFLEGDKYSITEFGKPTNEIGIGSRGSLTAAVLNSFEFGRCLVVKSNITIRTTGGTWLDVLASRGPLAVFLSEDGPNLLGVSVEYWTRAFQMVKVASGTAVVGAMEKLVKTVSQEEHLTCSDNVATDDTAACYQQKLWDRFHMDKEGRTKHCYLPQIPNATHGLPTCNSEGQAQDTRQFYIDGVVAIRESQECPAPCTCDLYDVSVRERLWKPNSGWIYI